MSKDDPRPFVSIALHGIATRPTTSVCFTETTDSITPFISCSRVSKSSAIGRCTSCSRVKRKSPLSATKVDYYHDVVGHLRHRILCPVLSYFAIFSISTSSVFVEKFADIFEDKAVWYLRSPVSPPLLRSILDLLFFLPLRVFSSSRTR